MTVVKIYPCFEHGEVAVPIQDLIHEGSVEVFSELTGKGLFDIDFRKSKLVLVAKSFVGVIPINPRVSIHVLPRFPVDNILYLVQRANHAIEYLPGFARGYQIERLKSGDAEEIFSTSLLDGLRGIQRKGIMSRYVTRDVDRGWRGRVLLAPTVGRFLSRGIRHQQVRQITEFSADVPENQIVKEMLSQVARYFGRFSDKRSQGIRENAAVLMAMFDRVSGLVGGSETAARESRRYIRSLSGDYRAYESLLWLCYLMASRQGVSIESFGPAQIETMVVNLADVFEGYVRQVIRDNLDSVITGGVLRDGNKTQPPLFINGSTYKVKPDIYVEAAGKTAAIIDAKYKPKLKSADRYEVIAFCEALESRIAVFVSPREKEQPRTKFLGETPRGVRLYEVRINLGADMGQEEGEFTTSLRAIVSHA